MHSDEPIYLTDLKYFVIRDLGLGVRLGWRKCEREKGRDIMCACLKSKKASYRNVNVPWCSRVKESVDDTSSKSKNELCVSERKTNGDKTTLCH